MHSDLSDRLELKYSRLNYRPVSFIYVIYFRTLLLKLFHIHSASNIVSKSSRYAFTRCKLDSVIHDYNRYYFSLMNTKNIVHS